MSLFEFVTVMVSMILALTLGQLLAGASLLLKSSREVRWYAPHALWLLTLGLTLVNHCWRGMTRWVRSDCCIRRYWLARCLLW